MTQPDPIQAQLIAARRHQILDAATKVFAEKGFHRATIKDVAKAAGVADGTIYNYFGTKMDLILGILDHLNETSQRATDFEQFPKKDAYEWMRAYMRQRTARLMPEGLQIFQVLVSEVLVNKPLRDLYFQQIIEPTYAVSEKFLRQWQEQGIVKQIDPRLAMRVLSGAFFGVLMLRLMGDKELESRWDEIADVLSEILMYGLMPGEKKDEQPTDSQYREP